MNFFICLRLNVDEKKRSNLEEIVNSIKEAEFPLPQRQRDGSDTEKQNKDSLYDQPNREDEASNKETQVGDYCKEGTIVLSPPRAPGIGCTCLVLHSSRGVYTSFTNKIFGENRTKRIHI